jgi:hypothetical protein
MKKQLVSIARYKISSLCLRWIRRRKFHKMLAHVFTLQVKKNETKIKFIFLFFSDSCSRNLAPEKILFVFDFNRAHTGFVSIYCLF